MQLPQDGTLLRIFIGEADKHAGKPLYEWIITLSEDLPIIVEIVDTTEKLDKFLELVEPQIQAGLVTLEKAQVRIYRSQT